MNQPSGALGALALENGLVTAEELDACLTIQSMMRDVGFDMPIGQVLVEKYYLDEISLRTILRAQAKSADRDLTRRWTNLRMRSLTEEENRVLIDQVSRMGTIGLGELDQCIQIQQALRQFGIAKHLGEILVEKGSIERSAVRAILSGESDRLGRSARTRSLAEEAEGAYAPPDPPGPGRESLHFGRIAVELGVSTAAQVDEILGCQVRLKEVGVAKRIGELLVERGWINGSQLLRILDQQSFRFGRIRRIDQSGGHLRAPESEEWFGRWLEESGLLAPEQIQECLYILGLFHRMGFQSKTLANVVVDRGYVDRKTIDELLFDRA